MSRPVADRVLGLYGEQQGGGKGVNFYDARLPVGHTDVVQVAVGEAHEPPDEREDKPADDESHSEEHEVVAPLDVNQRGEDVGQIAPPSLADVSLCDVHLPVLVHQAPPHPLRVVSVRPPVESLRDRADGRAGSVLSEGVLGLSPDAVRVVTLGLAILQQVGLRHGQGARRPVDRPVARLHQYRLHQDVRVRARDVRPRA